MNIEFDAILPDKFKTFKTLGPFLCSKIILGITQYKSVNFV